MFVCDPHPFTLQGVERAFKLAGLNVVGATTDPRQCLASPDEDGTVICFVDYSPGGAFGARLVSGLIDTDPTRRVVATSAHERIPIVASAYEAGACAFVTKHLAPEQVLKVIFAVDALADPRERYFPGNLGDTLATYYVSGGPADASPRRRLTNRQLSVFRMIAEGYTVTEVADRLQLNQRTVRNYLVAIRRRLKIPREHFRSCAIEHGLIDPLKLPSPTPRAPAATNADSNTITSTSPADS